MSYEQFFTIEVGQIRDGRWCERCHSSAGLEAEVLILTQRGVSKAVDRTKCLRCDAAEFAEDGTGWGER